MKITQKQFKELIEEEVKLCLKEYNDIPKNSNWTKFAANFDIGILDLDKFSNILGFNNFKSLDISITPKSLFHKNKIKFINALKKSSLDAQSMNKLNIITNIENSYM